MSFSWTGAAGPARRSPVGVRSGRRAYWVGGSEALCTWPTPTTQVRPPPRKGAPGATASTTRATPSATMAQLGHASARTGTTKVATVPSTAVDQLAYRRDGAVPCHSPQWTSQGSGARQARRRPRGKSSRRAGARCRVARLTVPRPNRLVGAQEEPSVSSSRPDERTLVLIKPDAVRRGLVGEIISRFERKGLVDRRAGDPDPGRWVRRPALRRARRRSRSTRR